MITRRRPRFILVLLLMLILILTLTAASPPPPAENIGIGPFGYRRLTVASTEFLGIVTFPTGTMFDDTEVGGLSGITYDAHRDVYYALSDDRSQTNPARFYTLAIDLDDGYLDDGDVTFLAVTFLKDKTGEEFPPRAIDPESIELTRFGQLFISTEGDSDASPPIDPFVNRFNIIGKQNRTLTIPDKFLPDGAETFGVRDNLAFESLTSTPNRKYLYTATENALHQDGPKTSLVDSSPSRVLEFRRLKWPRREYVYVVDPIPKASDPPGGFADNGLVELQAVDNRGTFLAMERSFAVGVGNTVILYETSTRGATNVSHIEALMPDGGPPVPYHPMKKKFVADFETDLGVTPDNLEGMTFGPRLPDGRYTLIVVSDNNFNPSQTTQFIVVAVELVPAWGFK